MTLIVDHDTADIASKVRSMAEKSGVSYIETPIDVLAEHLTRLSGDEVTELDSTQQLLIALKRAGSLDKFQAMKLQAAYLAEKQLAI